MLSFFNSVVYEPIYNALAFVIGVVPYGDVGVAIVIITILVRLILFPLSLKASRTQVAMREIDPKLKSLREQFKDNKEELARKTMALFKEHKVNPFASFLLILIQIPIVIGLYLVFLREGTVASFDPALLYSFITAPLTVSFSFLGLIDITGKSIILALIVAITQYFYARLTLPKPGVATPAGQSFKDDLARSMNVQMRYVFPIMLGVISYIASAAIALYFVTSNLFGIVQELVARRLHHGAQQPH